MYIADMLNDFNRIQNQVAQFLGDRSWPVSESPLIRLYSGKDTLALRALLPGIEKDSLEISITDDVVTIKGTVPKTETGEARVVRREKVSGEFTRTIELPFAVDPENSEAVLKEGVLTLTMPIRESVKPRQIPVKSNE